MRSALRSASVAFLCLLAAGSVAARGERLALRHVTVDLPGPPSKVIPSDLDGDGRTDLLVVVAYTEIEDIGETRVEDLVHITTVIPAIFDRREVRAYLATDGGGYVAAGEPIALPPSVLHMEPGPAGLGIVALTDEGLSRLFLEEAAEGKALRLEPVLTDRPILAGTRSFFPSLELAHDLNGDGTLDVLLPAADGLAVYLGTSSGIAAKAVDRIAVSASEDRTGNSLRRRYPLPEVRDVSGDGIADLVFSGPLKRNGREGTHVLLGSREGFFRPLRRAALDCHDELTDLRVAVPDPKMNPWPDDLVALRDLDGDGRAEAVTRLAKPRGESFRKELKDAKRPIAQYRFHRTNDAIAVEPEPYATAKVIGHAWEADADGDGDLPFDIKQFVDLDGDGRKDLITVTLDFSIMQALKILATKRISVGLEFHVYAQQADGSFAEVPGLDLTEKLKFDLDNLKIGRFAQFAGDFDGDGRQDFVHLGRGKTVTIHTGEPGCRYPRNADLTIRLEEEPASLDLVRVEDLDEDGRADLRITRPLPATDPDTTAPVRLDLYLSGGER